MSLEAFIIVQGTAIPALIPDERMRSTAMQLGMDPSDLFRVDVPAGMTRSTRACLLVASTQLATLYGVSTVSLTLNDGAAAFTINGLYARPPQPIFWGEQGGVALVELVDARWWWKFSSAAVMESTLLPLWSSDGRWQVNADIGTYTTMLSAISTAAAADNLTMPSGFSAVGTAYPRRMSDLVGSPNVSLSLLIDAIAVTTGQVIVSDQTGPRFINRTTLKTQYDARMNAYKQAYRGGMQPVNGAAASTDALVSAWNAYGYQNRAPATAAVVMPSRAIEGLTVYDNLTTANAVITPYIQQPLNTKALYAAGDVPSWTRQPTDMGAGYLTESAVVVNSNTGAVLTSSPGWNPTAMVSQIRGEYATRYSATPFGRTVWAGWVPWYSNATTTIGQLGNVSYRLAEIDGEMAPYTITECREDDWIFGLQGTGESDPSNVITAKGKAQAYRNAVGATIIDVPPPNTRVFPAKITGMDQGSAWKWKYSWEEVEPSNTTPSGISMSGYERKGTLNAVNSCEAGNVYYADGDTRNIIAPGVKQSDYTAGQIVTALPIKADTIVMMCEQFNTYQNAASRFWFSMPNAVKVACSS